MDQGRCLVSTPIGPVTVLWSAGGGGPLVTRVLLPGRPVPGGFPEASCGEIDALRDALGRVLAGEDVTIPLSAVDLSGCTVFQRKVLRALHAVPWGRVTTYGLLAARVGRPGGSRAVGTALATNPFPLIVPCHRVVRSDGTVGGFGGGTAMKRALLAMEGVSVDARDRVMADRFHYGKR